MDCKFITNWLWWIPSSFNVLTVFVLEYHKHVAPSDMCVWMLWGSRCLQVNLKKNHFPSGPWTPQERGHFQREPGTCLKKNIHTMWWKGIFLCWCQTASFPQCLAELNHTEKHCFERPAQKHQSEDLQVLFQTVVVSLISNSILFYRYGLECGFSWAVIAFPDKM